MSQYPDLNSLIEDVNQLVSLPEVYYQLEAALNKPHSSMDDLGKIISSDPDLTARLLGIANSAFYGFPAKIESISRALGNIGTRQLRDIVIATNVVRLFSRLPLDKVSMSGFWRHSLFTGMVARSIARALREPNIERFYLSGLLHDIGRLVLFLKLPEAMHKLLLQSDAEDILLYRLEQQEFGYDHADIGGALLEAWRLPQPLFEAVRFHHTPEKAEHYPLEAAAINVAGWLANREGQGSSGDHHVPEPSKEALHRLELGLDALATCVEESTEQFEEVQKVFF